MPNQPKTKGRTVRVDDDTWAAVEAEAKRQCVRASDVVRKALRNHLGLLLVALVLTGCAGDAQAASVTHKVVPQPVVSVPEKFTAETAREFAAINGGTPLPVKSRWACSQPMHISVAAPDGFEQQAYRSLYYPVAYLQALGYNVGMVAPTAYQSDITDQPAAGTVLLVVAPYHQDQSALGINNGAAYLSAGAATRSALVILDGSQEGLDPDVVLHEFGHILGLSHRNAGSVMQESWAANTGHFDADETATVACR